MKKKFLAGLLSLAMLLTLLPVSAFAAEAISGTITAEPDTVTAVLSSASADPDFTYTVTLGGYALPDAEQAADSTKDVTLTLPQTVDGTTTNYTSTVTLTYKVADDVASWELPTDQISFASGDPSTELLKATVAGTVATAAPQTEQYTIKFAAGDGATGEMADATQAKAETGDTTYTIPDSTFTAPTGKVFDKWTTDVGTVDGATLTIPAATETTDPITLTATWKDAPQTEQYTIKFAAGDGATGEMADATQAKAETGDTTYTIPDSTFTAPTGKVFDKWTTDVGTVDGATLTIPAATETTDPITLTATWKDAPQTEQYTIKFAAGDGATGEMADATQAKAETGDTTYTIPDSTFTPPTGKVFDKWTTDVGTVDGVTLTIPAATETTDPITLTATWKDASSSGDQPVADVAITLIPADGIAVGDTLPDAQTTNENVTLSTKWTNEAGDEVTKAESAGKYAATIEVTAKAGFERGTVKYTIDGEEVTAAETTATLTKEYTVEAPAPKEYNVTVNSEPTIGGTAAANVEKAAEGAEVTVTITPAEGYKVDTVTMGGTVVEDVTDNVFTFTMPAADVLVHVIFVEETTVNAEVSAPTADATGETSVSNDVVAAAIEKAKEDAGVEDNATVGKVEITAKGASRITLDQQAVETLTEAESVTVKAEAGEVTLPKEILNENKTKSLTLVVEEATRPDVAAAVEIKASYEVKVESNGQEVPVSNLSKPIKLRFTIDTNLTGEPTLAYFDTVSKKIKAIASSVYYPNTGVIEGEITHLTQIVVADKEDVDTTPDTPEPPAPSAEISVTWEAVDETDNTYYGGKLTVDGLDSSETYLVTYDNANASGAAIPRVGTVVKDTTKAELSCQPSSRVIVWKLNPGKTINTVTDAMKPVFWNENYTSNKDLGMRADAIR